MMNFINRLIAVSLCFLLSACSAVAMERSCTTTQLTASRMLGSKQELCRWLLQHIEPQCTMQPYEGDFCKRVATNAAKDHNVSFIAGAAMVSCYTNSNNGHILWSYPKTTQLFDSSGKYPTTVAMNKAGTRVVIIHSGKSDFQDAEPMYGHPKVPDQLFKGKLMVADRRRNVLVFTTDPKDPDVSNYTRRRGFGGIEQHVRVDSVDLINGQNGTLVKELEIPETPNTAVQCVLFNHQGTQLATGSHDGVIRIWSADDGTLQKNIDAHHGIVRCINYNASDDLMVSGADDAEIKLARLNTAGTLESFCENENESKATQSFRVLTTSFSGDSRQIVSGGTDKIARLWDIATKECMRKLPHKYYIKHAELSPDGNILMTTNGASITSKWDLRQKETTTVTEFVTNSMSSELFLLLKEIHKASLNGQLFKVKDHPLQQVWIQLQCDAAVPGPCQDIFKLVSRHVDCREGQ